MEHKTVFLNTISLDIGKNGGRLEIGYKNKKYRKNLHWQAHHKLVGMLAIGESKRIARRDGTAGSKIFSYNTYRNYWEHIKYFIRYIRVNHPEVTLLKKARKYVVEWLQYRENYIKKDGRHYSAWTMHTSAKALCKLFGIKPGDPDYYVPPKRNREDIIRSRSKNRGISGKNNGEFIEFCKSTGLRRHEIQKLKGSDLITKEEIEAALQKFQGRELLSEKELRWKEILEDANMFEEQYFLYVKGKGGRERLSPIIGPNTDEMIKRIRETNPDENVWKHVNTKADIHSFRAEYAGRIYKKYARNIEDIPYDKNYPNSEKKYQSEVFKLHNELKGKMLDKKAMLYCSKALGHNRINVVANNYNRFIFKEEI